MKNLTGFFVILIAGLLLQACSKKEEHKIQAENAQNLTFENVKFQKTYKRCNPDSGACTFIRLTYDKVKDGNGKDMINNIIWDSLLHSVNNNEIASTNLDTLASKFFAQYENLKKEFPETSEQYIELIGRKESESNKILTYSVTSFAFFGGAHPNTFLQYLNIYKDSPHCATLNDVFKPGFENTLNKIIEAKFRWKKKLDTSRPLTDGGLFEDKISYNTNFALLGDKLRFYYNPYEIAPYAEGGIVIEIPLSELKDILNPDFLK